MHRYCRIGRKVCVLLFLSLSSCIHIYSSDAALVQYVKSQNLRTDDVVLMFGDTGDKTYIAICRSFEHSGESAIVVAKDYWDNASKDVKENIMLHELGHCILNLKHQNNLRKDGCPESVMHSDKISPECYTKYKDAYREEMKCVFKQPALSD